jgi:uncharacterized RDD family membrane protein YckC
MNSPSTCLECGDALTHSDAGGLCPKCLLKLGLASQLASGLLPATAAGLAPGGVVTEPFDFGGYRIHRLLGKGGMGAVYEAEQRETGRRVALKVLGHTLDTPEMRQRFLREGQLAAAIRHPNSVAVFSAEEIEGAPVIAMELVPDGTLRDRVKRTGPLPVAEAVDIVLQIIDGLEAAHAGGVLHRDIKPANCFVAPDGTVKVGDFGLSISTLVKAEQQLTQPGAVLGTPAFASPEQLRAQEIDVRSDIYSVGATLYFLLTGQPTHDAGTLVALIAAVLERDSIDPQKLRPELPGTLSRVVMRCLARNAGARFANYSELRAALLPFRSAAAAPATFGLRSLAGLIDGGVMFLPWIVIAALGGQEPIERLMVQRDAAAFGVIALVILWGVIAISGPESWWGKGLGKKVCGLSVVRIGGGRPGPKRSLLRGVIFMASNYLYLPLLLRHSGEEYIQRHAETAFFVEEWLPFLFLALLFVTVRRRNGFAAIHDLATGTRVVLDPSLSPRPVHASLPGCSPVRTGERIGPFAICGREGEVIVAFDEALRRRVWVRTATAGAPPMEAARRDLSRAGRLRWLHGRRSAEENWDAFEAPEGQPLTAALESRHPWTQVRSWLFDLADELRAGLDDGTLPAAVGLDRIWLTHDGRAVLLEFPAPGARTQPTRGISNQSEAQAFLDEVATAVLQTPVPLHARDFLAALRARRFESMALVAGNLQAALEQPAAVTTKRRLLSLLPAPLSALVLAVSGFLMMEEGAANFDAAWQERWPELVSLRHVLKAADLVPEESTELRNAFDVVMAGRYRAVIEDWDFWKSSEAMSVFDAKERALARRAAKKHPVVGEEALATATKLTDAWLKAMPLEDIEAPPITISALFYALLGAFGLCGFLLTLVFGFVPSLRLADLAVVTREGAPARRWRLAWRSAVAWGSLILAIVVTGVAVPATIDSPGRPVLAYLLLGSYLAVLLFAALHPRRSIADYLAGTFIVPR